MARVPWANMVSLVVVVLETRSGHSEAVLDHMERGLSGAALLTGALSVESVAGGLSQPDAPRALVLPKRRALDDIAKVTIDVQNLSVVASRQLPVA